MSQYLPYPLQGRSEGGPSAPWFSPTLEEYFIISLDQTGTQFPVSTLHQLPTPPRKLINVKWKYVQYVGKSLQQSSVEIWKDVINKTHCWKSTASSPHKTNINKSFFIQIND